MFGPEVGIRNITAHPDSANSHRMIDRRLPTTWDSGFAGEKGDLKVELHQTATLAGIVLAIGTCPLGYPRELLVESSVDDVNWSVVYRGRTVLATVRAALDDPSRVPVSIPLLPTEARFLRLRDVGDEPGGSWCVAELSVRAPR
jgi:hypothetical protein